MHLGIDIGTSAVKAVIASGPSTVVATATVPLMVSSPHAGWSEQDPQHWWDGVVAAARELRDRRPDDWKAVRSIGLSGQMHGAVTLGTDCQPLRPAILWNDARCADQCRELEARLPSIGRIAGVPAMPGFTAPKIMWLRDHEPDLHRRIAHVLLPKDFVRLKLTGELATDCADAAGTMWLDQATRSWSSEACAASDTDADWLPRLCEGTEPSGHLLPVVAGELGLPSGIPVAAGGGDAAAGAMGIGAIGTGDCFISLGTSGQLFATGDAYRPNVDSAIHAYAHCVPDRWFQMAAMLNGASPMSWFAGLANASVGDLLDEAQTAPDDRTPLFLPYLSGERTPHNDVDISGCFFALRPSTDRASMMRAVVQAIAYSFCDARDALVAGGATIDLPAAIGGGSRSDFVLQTMSDAMAIPITRYAGSETGPALGAARLAMVAAGDATLADVAERPPVERTFEPDRAREAFHRDRLARYRSLYETLAPFAKTLNEDRPA